MSSGHHLGEVYDGWHVFAVQEDVELVEVAVYESVAGQLHNQLHQDTVKCGRVVQLVHLTTTREKHGHKDVCTALECQDSQRVALQQLHHHTVSVVVYGARDWEPSLMQRLRQPCSRLKKKAKANFTENRPSCT